MIKRIRLLILCALIVAALAAAVVPALAGTGGGSGGLPPEIVALNASFEGDKDGDGIPDKWNVKGDALRVCNHQYLSYDNCMMVFKPSNGGAAVWQILDAEDSEIVDWNVVTTEAVACGIGTGIHGALNLDHDRGYFGVIVSFDDSTGITLYAPLMGGTYPISPHSYDVYVPVCPPTSVNGNDVVQLKYGFLTLPGEGYLGVDLVDLGG